MGIVLNILKQKQNDHRCADDQMHFIQWKCIDFDYDFTEVCFQGSNSQYSSIGSDNGLAPARRQEIIWTNDG